ncbi:MAG: primosomal protein N' [Coriobacteriales bacterium]|nr:primosomal protein N' [Coriobacteriales bacterium]
MRYALVAIDITVRTLTAPFVYGIPQELEQKVSVGCCVLVSFGHRACVGYVLDAQAQKPQDLDESRISNITSVISDPFFDEKAACAIQWISQEYAAPPGTVARLFCPPGFAAKTVRNEQTGEWSLKTSEIRPADDRWLELAEEACGYTPRKNASTERRLLEILEKGPARQVEIALELGSVTSIVNRLVKKGIISLEHRRKYRGNQETSLSSAAAPKREIHELTDGQKKALSFAHRALQKGEGSVLVLDGVTGSGKTEVYLQAIEAARALNRDACVLVPEIALTPQTVGRFRSRFGDDIAVLHSKLSISERADQWERIRSGDAHIVVGARSALFAPLKNPGIYIIDEEHESSYKQAQAPRYHAREVAAKFAELHGALLILGSATPSLESLRRAQTGEYGGMPWTRIEMSQRPGTRVLPKVEIVDMRREFAAGVRTMFSRPLTEALHEVVEKQQKAVLLLNQRGFARFILCADCGHVPTCNQCSTSLTYHIDRNIMMCHTCGREFYVPGICPVCGSHFLGKKGVGTQQVEAQLRAMLPPETEIVRMDMDTTREKGGHERCLERFDAAESAVLLGTQMIAKGLDFPQVTLVGVINADTILKLCDFRSAERTYDLLEQVSGRAGRGDLPGRVIIQTYDPDHPAIQAAASHERSLFIDSEMLLRQEAKYPPYIRVSNVVVWGDAENTVITTACEAAQALRTRFELYHGYYEILGPTECVVSRIKGKYRWHIMIKTDATSSPGALLQEALNQVPSKQGINVTCDIDAIDLM